MIRPPPRLPLFPYTTLFRPLLRTRMEGDQPCPPWSPVSRPRTGSQMGTFRAATPAARRPSPRATPRRRAIRAAAARSRTPRGSSPWHAGRSPACARADRPAPRAAAGCCAAPPWAADSCGLDPERPLVRLAKLLRRRAQRRGDALLGEEVLHQTQAEVVAGALRQHLAAH